MLAWFRDNAKIFLVAIIVIFVAMIFVEWGSGRQRSASPETMAIASVNGNRILPGVYDAARNEVYTSLRDQMERSGNPYPENELTLLYNDINQAAFDLVVERTLQREFLNRLGWKPVHPGLAEQLVLAQIRLAGIPEPDSYFQQFRRDPNYGAAAYHLLAQADRSRFGSAMSLFRMSSRAEALFMAQDMYAQVQARYIPFRAVPELPDDSVLEEFYLEHPDLFNPPAEAVLRYATVLIIPSPEDEAFALNLVDSLAMAGGGNPDTLSVTRAQMLENMGWNLDLAPGTLSAPFLGGSLFNRQSPVTACHSVKLLQLRPGPDSPGPLDTLVMAHWELPAYPGINTIRETLWRIQDLKDAMTDGPHPFVADDLPIADWGELTVTRDAPLTASLTRSMVSFAMDTLWADSTGPVFYNPSFQGGYPAFTVARRLSYSPGGPLTLEEARESGILLLEAYTGLQEAQALEAAERALARCESTGCDLAALAESDNLELHSTEPFSPMSVRMAAASGDNSYRGLLGCGDFADAALLAPEYTVIGPFVNEGVAFLVEVTGRSMPDLESRQGALASVYLSLEQGYGREFEGRFLRMTRDRAVVEDLREEFFGVVDSIRTARGDVY